MTKRHQYEVFVGNIGSVYGGNDGRAAWRDYRAYRAQSVHGYGRAAGESVVLFRDGEPYREYVPGGEEQAD